MPIHRASSVRHALVVDLLMPDEQSLVVAKSNRLEIWQQTPTGLVLAHTRSIHGTITMLQKVRPASSTTFHIFVGTDRFQYFTLAWNSESSQLDTVQSFVDVSEKHMRQTQAQDRCLVDPTGKYFCLELFEGVLTFIRMLKPRKNLDGYLESPEQIRIAELFVRASTFLYTESESPKLALLYQAGRERVRLATYNIASGRGVYSDFDAKRDRVDDVEISDGGASHLIPVPRGEEIGGQRRYAVRNQVGTTAQLGGVIVIGETTFLYYDDQNKATVPYAMSEANIFVAWTAYDGTRFLLGDEFGSLHLLTLIVGEMNVVEDMKLENLGQISTPTCLEMLSDDFLFVGSQIGDSQVLRLKLSGPDKPFIEVIQILDNIAPVLDFGIMDMGNRSAETSQTNEYSSGQARIVAGTGAWQSGSLRSIRSGVGLEDIGLLGQMSNIKGLFSLSSYSQETYRSLFVDILVVSFLTETRILRFDNEGEVEEVEDFFGLPLNETTLFASNVIGQRILHVSPSKIDLVEVSEAGSVKSVSSWEPSSSHGSAITAASANDTFVLVSIDGKVLVSLDISKEVVEVARHDFDIGDEVACLFVPPTNGQIGVVGMWQSGSVSIIDLKTLQPIRTEAVRSHDTAAIPRSIVLAQVLPLSISGPTLLIAMSDGIVLTFSVDASSYVMSNRKSVVLGTQEANLRALPRADGLVNVFASCEHSSLIYGSEGHIVYSAVTAEDATYVAPFNAVAFPNSLVVATNSEAKISVIDTERRTHVKSLHMGETVRRIAHSASEKAFGIGTIKREIVRSQEIINSSFRLVDEVLFGELGQPFQLGLPDTAEMVEAVVRAKFPTAYGKPQERFVVGTSFLERTEYGGRLLVFAVDSNRSPYLIAQYNLKGACHALGIVDDKIVAALVKTVVVFGYVEESNTSGKLEKVASYRTASSPVDLSIEGNIIAVADMLKSISLLEYQPGKVGVNPQLVEVARHLQSVESTAVGYIAGGFWVVADAYGNLIVVRRNDAGVTLEDKKKLEVTGEFSLGEMVNRIRPISVEASEGAIVVPKAFLGTTEGSLYLLGTISPSAQDTLIRLQERLSDLVETPGNIPWVDYRSFRTTERQASAPWRFVDGELVERFLDLDEDMQEEVCKGLLTVQAGRDLVESLRRLH